MTDPAVEQPMICPWCLVEQTSQTTWSDHIMRDHAQVIRPPDLSVVREHIASDAIIGESTGTMEGCVDSAMFQVEHLVAAEFPPGAQRASWVISIGDGVDPEVAFERNSAAFAALVYRTALWAIQASEDPEHVRVTMTVAPHYPET